MKMESADLESIFAGKTSPYCFSEVGKGWEKIVRDLVEAIEAVAPGRVAYAQVKEKFGGLRFYWDPAYDEAGRSRLSPEEDTRIQTLVKEAEARAWKTCEDCGEPGRRRGEGWLVTLCDRCNQGTCPEAA